MPLRQAQLQFQSMPAPERSSQPTSLHSSRSDSSRSSVSSSETFHGGEDPDTIVVDGGSYWHQLPTPDESTMDASSESSHNIRINPAPQDKASRVNHNTDLQRLGRDATTEMKAGEMGRSVSGETLVTNTSQSSLLRDGIAALDLPWSVSSLVEPKDTDNESWQDRKIRGLDECETQLRAETAAARRAKMKENEELWEARKKAAEEKAVRRSSRASMLGKAGEAVSDLTASVLGKRAREVLGKNKNRLGGVTRRASLRPKSMGGSLPSTTSASEGLAGKSRRLSDGDLGSSTRPTEAFTIPRKPVPIRKDKKWLDSGLYAGQTRDFDARFSESTNKRRQSSALSVKENRTLPMPMFAGERIIKNGRDFKLPYDIFSPLPPGQPRPDEWRKTNKNVFVGDAAQVWRHSKPREHSTCMCTPETGCDDHCMNRYMFYECDEGNCKLPDCSNRSFQALAQRTKKGGKYNVGVEVIQTRDRGFGVRSNRTFEPNQIIVEYTGEIITQEECDQRMRTQYKDNECYYLMLFDQNMIIDATRGSIARFVNHSCEPNCRMEKWTVGGKPRMALYAGEKGIMTGDELTYDYNFDPFSQKNVQECHCGSRQCRGVLGPKPKDERKAKPDKESAAGKLAGVKRKMTGILDEGCDRWNKRPKLAAVPASAVAAFKKVTTAGGGGAPQPATAAVYRSSRPGPVQEPTGTRAVLVKKPSGRAAAGRSTRASIVKRPSSVLKGMVKEIKGTAGTRTRPPSRSSVAEAPGPDLTERPLSRKDSMKAKATNFRNSVVRTVRGG